MEPEISTKVDQWHRALPAPLADAVAHLPVAQILYEIGTQQMLTIEDVGKLADEVSRFISGVIRSKEFIRSVLELARGDREKAATIAEAVNERIFSAIRETLKRTIPSDSRMETERSSGKSQPAAMPPPREKPLATPAPLFVKKPEPMIIQPLAGRRQETESRQQETARPQVSRPQVPTPGSEPAAKPPEPAKVAPIITPIGIRPDTSSKEQGTGNKNLKSEIEMPKQLPVPPAALPIEDKKQEAGSKKQESMTGMPTVLPEEMNVTKDILEKEIARALTEGNREQETRSGERATEDGKPQPMPGLPKPLLTPSSSARPIEPLGPSQEKSSAPTLPQSPQQSSIQSSNPLAPRLAPIPPAPIKLSPEKFPRPDAPEKYQSDPYKEPIE